MVDLSEHDVFLVPAQFPCIQEAIDAVVRPATIMLGPGVYAESIRIVGKDYLVIESARLTRRGVVLSGADAGDVIHIQDSRVYLSGIEVRSNRRARGIRVIASSISLQDCAVSGNAVRTGEPYGAGMHCMRSSARIQKSLIAGNTIDCASPEGAGGGLYLAGCKVELAGSSIQTNEIYATEVARGGGIWCERSEMRMWRSRVTDNGLFATACEGAGVYFKDPGNTQLGGSVVSSNGSVAGNGGGVFIRGNAGPVAIHGNTVVRQNHPNDVHAES